MTQRIDGRSPTALRTISFEPNIQTNSDGSVLIRWGGTHVICSASIEQRVPAHRVESGGGWLTAEYAMLPGSGSHRVRRDRSGVGGRTAEIQRLIGRSLRAVFDMSEFGARTIRVDCDVLNADGGTRCASVTGGYVAAVMALKKIADSDGRPFVCPPQVVGVSIGVVDGAVLCDLCYHEDSRADVDLNFICSKEGIVEIQGTAETSPFSRSELNRMLDVASDAAGILLAQQRNCLNEVLNS
ncbi:MAG: ribonuclease PH [Bradymonadia bacterium]